MTIESSLKADIFYSYMQMYSPIFPKKTAYLVSIVVAIGMAACTAAAVLYPTLSCLIISITTMVVLLSVIIMFGIILRIWKNSPKYLQMFSSLFDKKKQIETEHNTQALNYDDLKGECQLFSLEYNPAKGTLDEKLEACQKKIKVIRLQLEGLKKDANKPQEEIEFLLKKKGLSLNTLENENQNSTSDTLV